MPVPEQARREIARWCHDRVPAHRRDERRVDYQVLQETVTIVERRPPEMPELKPAWSSRKVAQLRYDHPVDGQWVLFHQVDGDWRRYEAPPTSSPGPLLDEIDADPAGVFWP